MITYAIEQMGEVEEVSEKGLMELAEECGVTSTEIEDIIIDLEDHGFVVTISDDNLEDWMVSYHASYEPKE